MKCSWADQTDKTLSSYLVLIILSISKVKIESKNKLFAVRVVVVFVLQKYWKMRDSQCISERIRGMIWIRVYEERSLVCVYVCACVFVLSVNKTEHKTISSLLLFGSKSRFMNKDRVHHQVIWFDKTFRVRRSILNIHGVRPCIL